MMTYIVMTVLVILILLLFGAFFSMTETAFTSLSKITIRQMVKDHEKNSVFISKIKSQLDTLIATVLIGTNFVNTLNSAVVTAFAIKVFGPEYVTAATSVILILVIVFVEIIPKTYAAICSKRACQITAVPIFVIEKILFIVVKVFCLFTKFIDFLEKIVFKKTRPLITEEELRTLIEVGETEGTIEANEKLMLDRLFEFSDLTVHSIMRHRSLVKYVSIQATLEDVIAIFQESGYSRILVYENNIENIVGVLHFKSVLFADSMVSRSPDFVKICMSPVLYVPETFTAIDLLKKFKSEKMNFAVAVNEYGGMSGIVTMNDILHGVFGRITDEHGSVDVAPEKRVVLVGVNEFLVPGDMNLEDLPSVLNLHLESENFDTLGGWLLERFDELPAIGSVYTHEGRLFIVEDQSARRIQTVRIKLP